MGRVGNSQAKGTVVRVHKSHKNGDGYTRPIPDILSIIKEESEAQAKGRVAAEWDSKHR